MAKFRKLHLYLLVIGLEVETDVMVLVGVDGSSNDGCSCIGLVALLDGTTVTLFLACFLFGFGGAGDLLHYPILDPVICCHTVLLHFSCALTSVFTRHLLYLKQA